MQFLWRAVAVFVLGAISTLLTAAQSPSAGAPSAASTQGLAALSQLEGGQWQLESKGKPNRLVCVADGSELIQVEHDHTGCSRFVVANEPRSATVHYSCPGAGWGRTTIRVETPRQAHLQTQGIARNAPFDFTVQARRVGACGARTALK